MSTSNFCVLGRKGFLGSALSSRPGVWTSTPNRDTKILFHFASHTHPTFERNPEYEMKQVLDSFTQLLPWCYENGVLFVYPSSALVYEKETQFSRFKQTLESLVKCYKTKSLGLRIYPAYGPSEERTVISQWCRQMVAGIQPTVYGDGNQSRDFIFIDDVVDQIMLLVSDSNFNSRVIDIGTGVRTSFNEIVCLINEELGTNLEPEYVRRPAGYSDGIVCPSPLPVKVSVREGVRRILQSIRRPEMQTT